MFPIPTLEPNILPEHLFAPSNVPRIVGPTRISMDTSYWARVWARHNAQSIGLRYTKGEERRGGTHVFARHPYRTLTPTQDRTLTCLGIPPVKPLLPRFTNCLTPLSSYLTVSSSPPVRFVQCSQRDVRRERGGLTRDTRLHMLSNSHQRDLPSPSTPGAPLSCSLLRI